MVKCIDCGFFSVRRSDTRELVEVEEGWRTGTDARGRHADLPYIGKPICFMRAFPLASEAESPGVAEFHRIAEKERECSEHTDWQQGFSPKEHREMLDRKWMLQVQEQREQADREFHKGGLERGLEWREQQRRDDLEWREAQEAKAEERAGDTERKAEARHRSDIRWVVVFATLIVAGVTIAAAFIERGSWFGSGP